MKNTVENIAKVVNPRPFIIFLVLTILTTAFIFSNSMKDGEESNAQSAPIVEVVEKVLDPKDKVQTETFNYIVRKAAHVAEYTLLGVCLCGLMKQVAWGVKFRFDNKYKQIIFSLITGAIIASIDEIIQSFTGRTNSITDVMIDLVGVSLGVGIMLMVTYLLKRKKEKTIALR